jgi:hypothetical protein
VARVAGQRAHRVGGGVQQVTGVRRGVRLAEPVSAVAVNQDDVHRPPSDGEAEQVDSGERAAGAPADDRDDGPAAGSKMGEVHTFTIN